MGALCAPQTEDTTQENAKPNQKNQVAQQARKPDNEADKAIFDQFWPGQMAVTRGTDLKNSPRGGGDISTQDAIANQFWPQQQATEQQKTQTAPASGQFDPTAFGLRPHGFRNDGKMKWSVNPQISSLEMGVLYG